MNVTVSTGADVAAVEKYQIHMALGAIVPIPTLFHGAMLYAPNTTEHEPLTHWSCEGEAVHVAR